MIQFVFIVCQVEEYRNILKLSCRPLPFNSYKTFKKITRHLEPVCRREIFLLLYPSWHSDVVTTLSQRRCWRCHNVVARSKMRVVPTSVSDVVTTSLSNVVKTLPQRCYNVATTLSIGLLGHFTTDYSDFFPFIETWESYKSAKWH